jgi:hypothetical protein
MFTRITHISGNQGNEVVDVFMAPFSQLNPVNGTVPVQQTQTTITHLDLPLLLCDNLVCSLTLNSNIEVLTGLNLNDRWN